MSDSIDDLSDILTPPNAPRLVNGKVQSRSGAIVKVDIGGQLVDAKLPAGVSAGAGTDVQLAVQGKTVTVNAVLAGGGAALPVGSITMFMGSSIPTGWLKLDGSGFSATTYPELNAVLGGTTLPDFRDRVPIGASGSKGLNSTGGNASISLGVNELPPHTHDISNIGIGTFPTGSGANGYYPSGASSATTSTGSGNAFSILNPYRAVNYIIYAGVPAV